MTYPIVFKVSETEILGSTVVCIGVSISLFSSCYMYNLVKLHRIFSNVVIRYLSNYRKYIQYIKIYHVDRFGINFKCGRGDGADIAFHFNPRVSQGCVVRNTMQNGHWQAEEKHGGMPFKKETPFEIIFLVEESQFKVFVNGGRGVIRLRVLTCLHPTQETVSQ